jgi:hypothetical protein
MRAGKGQEPRILSLTPGRIRVHLPNGTGSAPEQVAETLRQLPGVEAVQANPLTGNVLIRFDPHTIGHPSLLAALQQPAPKPSGNEAGGLSTSALVQVGVRGVLGHAVVDACWFGAGFLGKSVGLPLLGALGPLHLLLDVVVWGAALASVNGRKSAGSRPAPPRAAAE